MVDVWLGLGSNLGGRLRHLLDALSRLSAVGEITRLSSLYETEPVGLKEQDAFLNAVACIRTPRAPREFFEHLHRIEHDLGRIRIIPNGPRTLDLDILFWGGAVIHDDGLTVPHPRLHLRRFVLVPLCELAPDLIHPVLGISVQTLLDNLDDPAAVARLAPTAEWPAK